MNAKVLIVFTLIFTFSCGVYAMGERPNNTPPRFDDFVWTDQSQLVVNQRPGTSVPMYLGKMKDWSDTQRIQTGNIFVQINKTNDQDVFVIRVNIENLSNAVLAIEDIRGICFNESNTYSALQTDELKIISKAIIQDNIYQQYKKNQEETENQRRSGIPVSSSSYPTPEEIQNIASNYYESRFYPLLNRGPLRISPKTSQTLYFFFPKELNRYSGFIHFELTLDKRVIRVSGKYKELLVQRDLLPVRDFYHGEMDPVVYYQIPQSAAANFSPFFKTDNVNQHANFFGALNEYETGPKHKILFVFYNAESVPDQPLSASPQSGFTMRPIQFIKQIPPSENEIKTLQDYFNCVETRTEPFIKELAVHPKWRSDHLISTAQIPTFLGNFKKAMLDCDAAK